MNLPDFSAITPRVVALDLDGTALRSDARMSERTRRAVLNVIGLGVPVVIATARPARVIPVLAGPEIAARASLVHMSGTAAEGRHPLRGENRWPLDRAVARRCWDIVSASSIETRMTVELDGHSFAVSHEGDANELWAFNTATPTMLVSLEEALERGPAKVSVNGLGNDLRPLIDEIEGCLSPDSVIVPAADNTFINVHSRTATKSRGIRFLIEPGGFSMSDVISFGDDFPDVDLIENTGWPVAVANAVPEVLNRAKYLTATNDEDGVALVLERLADALGRGKDEA